MAVLVSLLMATGGVPAKAPPHVYSGILAMSVENLLRAKSDRPTDPPAAVPRSLFAFIRRTDETPRAAWSPWLIARGAGFGLSAKSRISPPERVTVLYPGIRVCVGEAVASFIYGDKETSERERSGAPKWKPAGEVWKIEGCPTRVGAYEVTVLEGAHPSAHLVDPTTVPKAERDHARALADFPAHADPYENHFGIVEADGWRFFLFSFERNGQRTRKVVVTGHGQKPVVEDLSLF